MDLYYPHIAARVFNTPLLVAPQKLEVIVQALTPRFLGVRPEAGGMEDEEEDAPWTLTPEGIALIPVTGTLVKRGGFMSALSGLRSYERLQEAVMDAATSPQVKAILLDIDSPGGEVNGLFDLVDTLFEARDLKPLWAVANDDAFSAAYGIASAADRLWLTRTGGVGSVGVVAVHLDHSRADQERGLTYTVFRAGQYKAEHNAFEPLTDHARQTLQTEIDRLHREFAGQVARNRRMSIDTVLATEANLYYGPAALEVGFADRIGTREDALQALAEQLARRPFAGAGLAAATEETNTLRGVAAHETSREEELTMSAQHTAESAATPTAENKVVDLDSLQAKAKMEERAYQKQVRALCRLAGRDALADEYIDKGLSLGAVSEALLRLRAEADEAGAIASAHPAPTLRSSAPVDLAAVQAEAFQKYRAVARPRR